MTARTSIRPVILLLTGPIALGVVLAMVAAMLVIHLHGRAFFDAAREQARLALMLADQAERSFEAVELVQTEVLDRIHILGITTPEQFKKQMASVEEKAELRRRGQTLPQLDAIILVGADGTVVNSTRPEPLPDPPISVADQDFRKTMNEQPERSTFVGEADFSDSSRKWTMYIVRKINSPDGRLLGLIEGPLSLPFFDKLYASVAPGPASVIAMYRQDGQVLERYPYVAAIYAKFNAFDNRYFRILRATGADAITIRDTGTISHDELLVSGHSLVHYPIVVLVINTVAAILAEWRGQAVSVIVATLILELVLVGVGWLMLRQSRGRLLLTDALAAAAEAVRLRAEAGLAMVEEREQAASEMQRQHGLFGAALSSMSYALCMFDNQDRVIVMNSQWNAMFGYPAGSVPPGTKLRAMLELEISRSRLPPREIDLFIERNNAMKAAGQAAYRESEMPDGRTLAARFAPVDDNGWLMTYEDITEKRIADMKILHMAHHDALTGLANRMLFQDKLSEAMARTRRGEAFALMYLDLDHFKAVNDTFGHPAGDALLEEVTRRLLQQVREIDTVARLGGDEFAILEIIDRPSDAAALATRLVEVISAPYEVEGHRVVIGISIGIAIAPDDGENPDGIMKNADLALYQSKSGGRGRYKFFEPEINERIQARRVLDLDLRKALAEGEFRVFYQPLINIAHRTVCGFEALVRWQHPEKGMISPADFIPLAEEIGLIVPLGNWVLRQACADASTWPDTLKVAVNLSPVQLGSQTLVADVAAALADSKLRACRLELEITETAMLEDTDTVFATLHLLHDLGLQIALDDFGTGYSSLSHLQRFRFNKVKIDRSFVAKLDVGDENNETIVASVIDLCGRLGMVTTAEGVETPAQLHRLESLHCVEAQGYLFSRPCPAGEVSDTLVKLARINYQ